jgi:hypothetical protein
VRNQLGLRRNSRRRNFDGREKVLPNDGGGYLGPLATSLIKEDADLAIVVVIDAPTGAEDRRTGTLMRDQTMMVMVGFFRDQVVETVAQYGNAAINGEQYAGHQISRESPHGGMYARNRGQFAPIV